MIVKFRHKGFEKLFKVGSSAGIQAEHAPSFCNVDVDYEDSH